MDLQREILTFTLVAFALKYIRNLLQSRKVFNLNAFFANWIVVLLAGMSILRRVHAGGSFVTAFRSFLASLINPKITTKGSSNSSVPSQSPPADNTPTLPRQTHSAITTGAVPEEGRSDDNSKASLHTPPESGNKKISSGPPLRSSQLPEILTEDEMDKTEDEMDKTENEMESSTETHNSPSSASATRDETQAMSTKSMVSVRMNRVTVH